LPHPVYWLTSCKLWVCIDQMMQCATSWWSSCHLFWEFVIQSLRCRLLADFYQSLSLTSPTSARRSIPRCLLSFRFTRPKG